MEISYFNMKNKGQITIGIGIAISFIVSILGGAGFIYGIKSDVKDVVASVETVKIKHQTDLEALNGKLDLLLENFKLKYVPK